MKMGNFKKISTLAPILSATLVVSCIGVSLSSYTAPVYAVEIPEVTKEKTEQTDNKSEQAEKKTNSESHLFDLEDGIYEGTGMGYGGKIIV